MISSVISKGLDKVTITGIDNSVSLADISLCAGEFPFVEFGILFSVSKVGQKRYPDWEWLNKLFKHINLNINFSAHLCGKYVRDLLDDNVFFWEKYIPKDFNRFKRIQINTAGDNLSYDDLNRILDLIDSKYEVIFQTKTFKIYDIIVKIIEERNRKISILLDASGGRGKVAENFNYEIFNNNIKNLNIGVAGGICPENINIILNNMFISAIHYNNIKYIPNWIDIETGARDLEDNLSWENVRKILTSSKPCITKLLII